MCPECLHKCALEDEMVTVFIRSMTEVAYSIINDVFGQEVPFAPNTLLEEKPTKEFCSWRRMAAPHKAEEVAFHAR
jgi:hypothetical protein